MRASEHGTRRRPGRTLWWLLVALVVVVPALGSGTVARAVSPSASPSIPRDASGREYREPVAKLGVSRSVRNGRTLFTPRRMRLRRQTRESIRAAAAPLVFGIYPGGAAGTVGPAGETKAEVADLRVGALNQLRADGQSFVLHLYDSFTRPSDADAVPSWLRDQIADYTAHGFSIELVLTYRPAASGGDADGFADFVRARVRQLGSDRHVTHIQVTNEANVAGAPDAADGAYRGARDALIRGVIAAKDEARRNSYDQLQIGFNWAYQLGRSENAFFSYLGSAGGSAFSRAVDWVGLDAYPGTWGPALPKGDLADGVRLATVAAMRQLRETLLPLARLSSVPMHFAESGYPTGPQRSEAMQQTVLTAAVETIHDNRAKYGVTDYRWFDLRDADSTGGFESQYGITRDDYSAKPAFFAYRDLIAKLG